MSLEAATIRKNHYILTWCLEFTICSLLLSVHYTVYDFSYIFLQDECIFFTSNICRYNKRHPQNFIYFKAACHTLTYRSARSEK